MNHLSTIIPFVFMICLFVFCAKNDKNSEKGRKNKEEYVIMS
jgi:preprotein translocase subunit YajC